MIRKGTYSTPMIAEKLGVSIPTVSRDVTALRQRGYDIRAERRDEGGRYLIDSGRGTRRKRRGSFSDESAVAREAP